MGRMNERKLNRYADRIAEGAGTHADLPGNWVAYPTSAAIDVYHVVGGRSGQRVATIDPLTGEVTSCLEAGPQADRLLRPVILAAETVIPKGPPAWKRNGRSGLSRTKPEP